MTSTMQCMSAWMEAEDIHLAGLLEDNVLVRRIALVQPEVETRGVGNGKDVVIDIVIVRPLDRGAGEHGQDVGRKGRHSAAPP